MTTKPLESILFRDLSLAAGEEDIELVSPLLGEVINFSTNVFRRCIDSASGEENVDLATQMLYLHQIEMADGVDILVQKSSPNPSSLLLRSMLEANFYMEYILESDYVNRSLSWLLFYVKDQLRIAEELDKSTDTGKRFLKSKENDIYAKDMDFSSLESMALAKKDNLNKLLLKDQFKPIIDESSVKKYSHWYSLFGGPSHFYALSKYLNREIEYLILYSGWSRISHAVDISRFLKQLNSNNPLDFPIRNPSDIRSVTGFAIHYLLISTKMILSKFRPGESLKNWYLSEVQERYKSLWKPK